jgi:hypothetical protein
MMIEKWEEHHKEVTEQLVSHLDLPAEIAPLAFTIWKSARLKAARVPKSLIVDCVYMVAHMTGNRRSITDMRDSAMTVIQRRTKPFNQDRRKDSVSWIETDWAKRLVLSVIPDEQLFEDFLNR